MKPNTLGLLYLIILIALLGGTAILQFEAAKQSQLARSRLARQLETSRPASQLLLASSTVKFTDWPPKECNNNHTLCVSDKAYKAPYHVKGAWVFENPTLTNSPLPPAIKN